MLTNLTQLLRAARLLVPAVLLAGCFMEQGIEFMVWIENRSDHPIQLCESMGESLCSSLLPGQSGPYPFSSNKDRELWREELRDKSINMCGRKIPFPTILSVVPPRFDGKHYYVTIDEAAYMKFCEK